MEEFDWSWFIIGFVVTWVGMKFLQKYLEVKNEILREELEELQKKIKEKFIHVKIEKHGDLYYLFEKDTDRFIAQGSNMHELKLHCDARFKNSTVIADNKELELYGLE